MTRAEFDALTDEVSRAHGEYFGFMKPFLQPVVTAASQQRLKLMTDEDLAKARQLRDRLTHVENLWFEVVRSAERLKD
jgi:hypothetical protein